MRLQDRLYRQLRKQRHCGLAILFLLQGASALSAQTVQTPIQSASISYSATAHHRLPGQPETSGKIVKSAQNIRLEFEQDGQSVIQILRPTEGLMFVLNPQDKTYFELRSQAMPAVKTDGYSTPCPDTTQIAHCERIGTSTVSGIAVERWALTRKPQSRPLIILWDSTRRRALRQEFPDGSVMAMRFQAMQDLNGRMTEHWVIKITMPDQPANTGSWWFDPELRLVVREDLPGGEIRRLENITTGAVEDTAFLPPEGWEKQNPPTVLGPPQSSPSLPRNRPANKN